MNIDLRALGTSRGISTAIALIALLHCALWYSDYGQTALGESPALDNRQTLELARTMAQGELPAEPFHRAPLYPYLLSLFLTAGTPYELLPWIARWLNALALTCAAVSTAACALKVWRRPSGAWIAGLLVALNPIFVFFAGDAFDILLATAAFSAALTLLPRWLECKNRRHTLTIGLLLTLGSALRSHLLPLAILWPVAAALMVGKARTKHGLLAATPLVLSFLLLGLANWQVAGEFRVMPWQGAYNLWAGNGPEANGRIYAQKIRVDFNNGYDNPAKLESIALYERETGATPPHSINAMNAYWKQKTLNYIAEHPLDWLGLMSRKGYYFLNSYEQYDNKTYGFHKQRHTLLRWNPIHWGALLLLAVTGTLAGLRDERTRPFLIAAIIVFAAYAAGTILFYTSNRFRLPMVPVLSILAGGVILLPIAWCRSTKIWKTTLFGCLGITALITYSNLYGAKDENTWQEDYALLANASLRVGKDQDAIRFAKDALNLNPSRHDMQSLIVQAAFNNWALNPEVPHPDRRTVENLLHSARNAYIRNPKLAPIVGIYLWKLGQRDSAQNIWLKSAETQALGKLCLLWNFPDYDIQKLLNTKPDKNDPATALLQAAIAVKTNNIKEPRLTQLNTLINRFFLPVEKVVNTPSGSNL